MDFRIQTPAQLTHHLRALRKARGLSQADLGALMGLSQSRIARMEKSPTHISVDALLLLLSALQSEMLLSNTPGERNNALVLRDGDVKGDW